MDLGLFRLFISHKKAIFFHIQHQTASKTLTEGFISFKKLDIFVEVVLLFKVSCKSNADMQRAFTGNLKLPFGHYLENTYSKKMLWHQVGITLLI